MSERTGKQTELLLQILLTAEQLRFVANAPDSGSPGLSSYTKSTASLAALLEGWCIDHAFELRPDLKDTLGATDRNNERQFLELLKANLLVEQSANNVPGLPR